MTSALDPQLVFDRYVVGAGNRLAAAAARRAAESPGRSYNPLVICGPPGLGKTHLLMAIGQRARALDPDLVVHYETLESFVDRVTTSISAGTMDEFRAASGQLGLLLLDDLQHLGGMARTQDELLRIWAELAQRGAQIVIAADRPPQEIPALDARLASRLASGLTVDIAAPDAETRGAILRQIQAERGLELAAEVIDALARLPIENVRELQGALNRILAAVDIEERRVEAGEVAELLGLGASADAEPQDEFAAFLSDISRAVTAVVETAPWRRRLAESILYWEGEGILTRRLEAALDTDSAPDVEALLSTFARDVDRLRRLAAQIPAAAVSDPLLLRDPDRLEEAEALLAQTSEPRDGGAGEAPAVPGPAAAPSAPLDRWFLDGEKIAWSWVALEERIAEEQR